MKRIAQLVPLLAALSLSTSAFADEKPTAQAGPDDAARSNARELATSASDAYRRADYASAYDGFNRAFRLVSVPALGVWSARSLTKLGRFVEASERYRDVLKIKIEAGSPETYQAALKDAEKELAELTPRIPSLLLTIQFTEGDGTEVSIDGHAISTALIGVKQKLDPGTHHILAKRGEEVIEYDVALGEREAKEIELSFDAPHAAKVKEKTEGEKAPVVTEKRESGGFSTLETTGLVTMGAGVAFLGGGIVLTFLALDKQSALEKGCTSAGACPSSSSGDLDTFNTLAPLSTAGLIAGGVLLGAGAGLFFFGGEKSNEPSAALYTNSREIGVRGTF